MAGGTGIALQIKHRTSIDFDFYIPKEFDAAKIYRQFQEQKPKKILLDTMAKDTLLLELNDIGISLFTYPYPLLKILTESDYFNLASLEDIAAMKMIAIIQRGIRRDFVDLYFLIEKVGLEKIFRFAKKKYPGFNEYLALQALACFGDAEVEDKELIITQVLNYGDAKRIKWLYSVYTEDDIKKVVCNPRRGLWFPKVLNLWETILEIKIPKDKREKALFKVCLFYLF